MKGKIFKVGIILLVILTMTMTNFIFVSNCLISYALDNISTNNNNVEFGAYFKDDKGNKVVDIEKSINDENMKLYLYLKVKQEGYFNGKVQLEESNFKLKEVENDNINKIEGNTITLNQINAGSEVELEIPIEFEKQEAFDLGLLNMESKINLNGIYRDRSQKDKEIKAEKEVTLKIVPKNETSENIENSAKVITNKTLQVAGVNKRVIQILLNVGLKDNSYPIKEMNISSNVPDMNEAQPEVSAITNLSVMTHYDYKFENKELNINLKNDVSEQNNLAWKNEGNETIVVTYLYNPEKVEDVVINGKVNVTLYNDTKIEADIQEVAINKDDEKEEIVTANIENDEETIYKGKLYQGIDREFITKETINVNAQSVINYMEIKEKDVFTTVADYEENTPLPGTSANTVYRKTIINKEQLFNILGDNGNVEIKSANGEFLTVITKETQADEKGNILINYGEAGQADITIRTTAPVKGGKIQIAHMKAIKQNSVNQIKNSVDFNTGLFVTTNLNEGEQTPKQIVKTPLGETLTEATLEVDKAELSTVVENDVELKAILKSKNESNDLYKNPTLKLEFPEDVEQITITNVQILYDDELKVKNTTLDGRVLTIVLEGEQTHYSENAVEGANILINGKVKLNRKAATKDTQIVMSYSNQKAQAYANDAKANANIKVVAPTDVTTVTSIEQLGIEELGQENSKEIMLEKGKAEKEITPQIEVINNKESVIKDVKILGTFPTGEEEGEVGINLTTPMQVENATVYYSQNENATDDLSNEENGWSEKITSASATKKYLIAVNEVAPQESIIAKYNAVIPANLEYNENASQDYQVTYTDANTNTASTIKSTQLKLTTGVGPKLDVKVSAKVGNDELKSGDEVRAGELIKYKVEVSNTGTENVSDVTISAPVPEGTTYVEPKENYDWDGLEYYEEIQKDKCEEKVNTIEIGKTVTREYEVRVNKDIMDNTEISNISTAKFDEVTTESNNFKTILKSGNMRVSIKKISTKGVETYVGRLIKYYVIVENISDSYQKNVEVKSNLSNGLSVYDNKVKLKTGSTEAILLEGDNSEDIEYNKEKINIGDFEPNEIKLLYYGIVAQEPGEVNLSVTVMQGENNYRSNVWNETAQIEKAEITMVSDKEKYLKSDDILEYTITVKNTGDTILDGLVVEDEIPPLLEIKKISIDGKEEKLPSSNKVQISLYMSENEEKVVKIQTRVKSMEMTTKPESISNKATLFYAGKELEKTNELIHIIQPEQELDDVQDDENGENQNNNSTSNNIEDNNFANGTKMISGNAWYDTNADGKKDTNEQPLSGIKVNLLNAETNQLVKDTSGKTLEATTDGSGTYLFSNIGDGKYIAVFYYDTVAYSLTKYKVVGVDETINSDVMLNDIQINGTNQKLASTDIIQVENNNIANINIGLIKLQNFDLKLDKYVSKILIQNSAGTAATQYNDSKMAKAEIHSKQINGSTVLIEYKIRVTNVGEVEGYVKKIADYIPSDLKFNSELNKDWYQSGSDLYNTSLANEKISAGESKEVTLTLVKSMTEDNTGLVNNTAEIAETYNELGIEDSNSKPGNKTQGENDMSSADVIISVSTGEIIFYTTLFTIIAIAMLTIITVLVIKNTRKKQKNILDKI